MKAKVNVGHLKSYLTRKSPVKEKILSLTLTDNSNNSNNCGLSDSSGEVNDDATRPGSPPEKKKYLVNCDSEQVGQVLSPLETNSSPSNCTVMSNSQAQPSQLGELLQCNLFLFTENSPKKIFETLLLEEWLEDSHIDEA